MTDSTQKPRLSIVMGTLREEKRIGKTLDLLSVYLREENLLDSTELVIAVPEGGDRTKEVILEHAADFPAFTLVEPGKPLGKGRDIRAAMQAAHGELKLFMDADLATPLHHVKTILDMFDNEHPDIVIGTRKLTIIHKEPLRRFISLIGNFSFLVVSGFYSPDTQCGFKAFTAEAADLCFSKMTRLKWSFDMELLTIANVNKLHIQQIAINDWEDKPDGPFKEQLKKSHGLAWQFFKDLLRIFTNRVTGKYKLKKR